MLPTFNTRLYSLKIIAVVVPSVIRRVLVGAIGALVSELVLELQL